MNPLEVFEQVTENFPLFPLHYNQVEAREALQCWVCPMPVWMMSKGCTAWADQRGGREFIFISGTGTGWSARRGWVQPELRPAVAWTQWRSWDNWPSITCHLHYPFPCKAVREHGEKAAMFCAHMCPLRGHLGGCSLFVQCLNHNHFAKLVSASSLNIELEFWEMFIKCTFLHLIFAGFHLIYLDKILCDKSYPITAQGFILFLQ